MCAQTLILSSFATFLLLTALVLGIATASAGGDRQKHGISTTRSRFTAPDNNELTSSSEEDDEQQKFQRFASTCFNKRLSFEFAGI